MPLKSWVAVNKKDGHSLQKGVPVKWSKQKAVCGISVVKRKITANLAVIFLKLVDPRRIELPNLSDANGFGSTICGAFRLFSALSSGKQMVLCPLVHVVSVRSR